MKIKTAISNWYNKLANGSKPVYWVTYTIVFVLMFLIMGFSSTLFAEGKGFIWLDDGLTQQYTSFVQLGQWYRDLFANTFSGNFVVPMWSDDLGYGNDAILSIGSYLGNPLYIVSAFATAETADVILNATVVVTLFLSGVFFTLFARYRNKNGFYLLVGCVVYLFTGFTLTAFVQVHMLYPLMLGPLVFLGIDLVFDKRSPVLFVVATALIFINSIESGYVCCLLLLVYCIVRYIELPEKKSVVGFLIWFAKIFGLLVLAVMISAVLFLPSALSILSQDRVGLERPEQMIYPLIYYYHLFVGLIDYRRIGSECFIGFFSIAIVAVAVLFATKSSKQKKALVTMFVILSLFLLLPFVGKMMNGFAYANNRWNWAYSLLVAYIVVAALPHAETLEAKQRKRVLIIVAAFLALSLVALVVKFNISYMCNIAILALLCVCFFVFGKRPVAWRACVFASLFISCAVVFFFWGTNTDKIVIERHALLGDSYEEAVESNANAAVLDIEGTDWRYDVEGDVAVWRNSPIATGKNGIAFYNSFYNSAIDELHTKLGLTSSNLNFAFENLDSRQVLEQLAGVEYVVSSAESGSDINNSVSLINDGEIQHVNTGDAEYDVHKAKSVLPLAFTYDSAFKERSLDNLLMVQREDALLLEMAVNDDPSLPGFSEYKALDELCTNIPIEDIEDTWTGGEVIVPEGGLDLKMNVELPAGKRIFLEMGDISYVPNTTALDNEIGMFDISVSCGQAFASTSQTMPSSSLYSGKNDWAFNLGISNIERDEIVVHFSNPGTYLVGRMAVACEDEQAVAKKLQEMATRGANDITFKNNVLTCSVNAPASSKAHNSYTSEALETSDASENAEASKMQRSPEYLFVRLPYSDGWSAKIDGQNTPLLKANIGFMGIQLSEGNHTIELAYETPGLKLGAALSCAGVLALIALIIIRKRLCGSSRACGEQHPDSSSASDCR